MVTARPTIGAALQAAMLSPGLVSADFNIVAVMPVFRVFYTLSGDL